MSPKYNVILLTGPYRNHVHPLVEGVDAETAKLWRREIWSAGRDVMIVSTDWWGRGYKPYLRVGRDPRTGERVTCLPR